MLWIVSVFVIVSSIVFVFVFVFVLEVYGAHLVPAAVDGCGICAAAHQSVPHLPPTNPTTEKGRVKSFTKLPSSHPKYLKADHMRSKSLLTTKKKNGSCSPVCPTSTSHKSHNGEGGSNIIWCIALIWDTWMWIKWESLPWQSSAVSEEWI